MAGAAAKLKKTAKPEAEEPFTVPTLEEVDAEYSALVERLRIVGAERVKAQAEAHALETDLKSNPSTRHYRPEVAAMLGEVANVDDRPQRLAATRKQIADAEDAEAILMKRIRERQDQAGYAVCDLVRPEFARRVADLCAALEVVQAARAGLEELCDQLDREGVAWSGRLRLTLPFFLGDRNDGALVRYLKEAKEAGYVD